jgi:hypothetical protein
LYVLLAGKNFLITDKSKVIAAIIISASITLYVLLRSRKKGISPKQAIANTNISNKSNANKSITKESDTSKTGMNNTTGVSMKK